MSTEHMKSRTADDSKDRFVLRFHDERQRAKLKARAALNRRTMNSELLYLIERGQEAVDGKSEKENAPSVAADEALVQQ